jgi:predicted Zn-dependent protease
MIKNLFLIFLLSSCATSPTGRKQLILISDSQVTGMGIQSFTEMKAKIPIENDPDINKYVKCVTDPIIKAQEGKTNVSEWEVVVFKDASANAFALPGGKIGVHTGILKVAQTDSQLATVLGHEVGHVMAHHGQERVSQSVLTQIGFIGVNAYLGGKGGGKNRDLIMAALGVGTQVAILLPYSRTHESEADQIGLDLMAQAGFDPKQSVVLWENMKKAAGGKSPPEFFSTHPAEETRIKNLTIQMEGALKTAEEAHKLGNTPRCKRPKNI